MGAGQQSRIHCTRLAGNKADIWYLRQHPKVLSLPFADRHPPPGPGQHHRRVHLRRVRGRAGRRRAGSNSSPTSPEPLTREEKRAWLDHAHRRVPGLATPSSPSGTTSSAPTSSGVQYIAEPGGSIRDDNVIDTCDKYGMAMAFTGMRLFHH